MVRNNEMGSLCNTLGLDGDASPRVLFKAEARRRERRNGRASASWERNGSWSGDVMGDKKGGKSVTSTHRATSINSNQ